MWLQMRMYMLLAAMFGIVYAAAVMLFPTGSFIAYGFMASIFLNNL